MVEMNTTCCAGTHWMLLLLVTGWCNAISMALLIILKK